MASNMQDIILALLSANNLLRKQAEEHWNRLKSTQPRSAILGLIDVLEKSSDHACKSLSVVLLRGITIRDAAMWKTLSDEDFNQTRHKLLELLVSGSSIYMSKKIADVVAAHVSLAEWPELMQRVIELYSSGEKTWIVLSLYLLDKLAEHVGGFLISNIGPTMSIIFPSLELQDLEIRTAAASAFCSIIFELPEYNEEVCSGLIKIPKILGAIVDKGEEQLGIEVLQSTSRLCKEKPDFFVTAWEPFFAFTFALCASSSPSIEATLIASAVDCCVSLLLHPRSAVFSSSVATRNAMLTLCLQLLSRIEDTDGSINSISHPETDPIMGDADEEGSEGLAEQAMASLDSIIKVIDPAEAVQVILPVASSLLQSPDWRERRAALIAVSVASIGATSAVQPHLPSLVAGLVGRFADPHPRVRFTAFSTLAVLSQEFGGIGDDDDDDEDRGNENSFQALFHSTLPAVLFKAINENLAFPRIVHVGLLCLKTFFNPDTCKSSYAEHCSAVIVDFAVQCMTSADATPFLKEEAASVLANLAVLSKEEIIVPRYRSIVTILSQLIAIDASAAAAVAASRGGRPGGQDVGVRDFTMVKCKSLEAFALVGKAVGADVFAADAHALLAQMATAVQQPGGLDYSDPFTSYIFQTAARIASVIGDSFQPYLAVFVAPVLARLAEPFKIEISDEDGLENGDSATGGVTAGGGQEVVSVYKRGHGSQRITYNSHEIIEKEMGCRILFQYFRDLPQLIWRSAPAVVDAVAPLAESMQFSHDVVIVSGSLQVQAIRTFLVHCTEADAAEGNRMVNIAASNLVAGIEKLQLLEASRSPPSALANTLVESLSDVLKVAWDNNILLGRTAVGLSADLMGPLFISLRDEAVLSVGARMADTDIDQREEMLEIREGTWSGIINALGWAIKLYGNSAAEVVRAELAPFLQSLLATITAEVDDSTRPLLVMAICCFLDATESIPAMSADCSAIISRALLENIRHPDTVIPCAFGLGVCAMHGGVAFNDLVGDTIIALMTLITVAGARSIAGDDEDLMNSIRDNAISSLFKLCIFRAEAVAGVDLGQSAEQTASRRDDLLLLVMQSLPLQCDRFEARALHGLLVRLLRERDLRLLGARPDCILQAFIALLKLGMLEPKSDELAEADDELAYWDNQPASAATVGEARQILRAWLLCSSYARSNPATAEAAAMAEQMVAQDTIDALLEGLPAGIKPNIIQFATKYL